MDGEEWGRRLEAFLERREEEICHEVGTEPTRSLILTGTLQRDTHTRTLVRDRPDRPRHSVGMRSLNELCAGSLDSMSYSQIKQHYPDEHAARQRDKLRWEHFIESLPASCDTLWL